MKRLALILLVLGFARSASAQSLYHYENILLTQGGTPIANASIYVCAGIVSVTNGQPPCGTTTVYAAIDASAVKIQPFTSGPLGNYDFYANPGVYTVALVYNNNATADVVTIPATSASLASSSAGARYVTATGNDANDGLSIGTAKLTIAAAYATLANCTNIAFSGFPTNVQYTAPCGTIYLGESTAGYSLGSTLTIQSPFVKIIGLGEHPTVLNCTVAASCISWTANTIGGVAFFADFGLYNLTVNGTNAANQVGMLCTDCVGLILDHVRFSNFAGTSGEGLELKAVNFYMERTQFNNVWWDNCTVDLVLNGAGGAPNNSYGHNFWNALAFMLNNGQIALLAKGNAQMYSSFVNGVINTNPPGSNTYTGVVIQNTALIRGNFGLIMDNGGGGTLTASTGTTPSNFQVWGWGQASNQQSLVTQDLPAFYNVTTASATNSPAWAINNVVKWNQYLDGSNNMSFFDVVNAKETVDFRPGTGEIDLLEGACGSAFAALDTICADSTSHTVKISNNGGTFLPATQTIAKGTAAMTTAGILTGACGTTVTAAATGTLTTDVINISHNAAVTIGNGGGLTLNAWPTADNVNFNYCNSAAGTITPTAMTINWQVTR